MMKSYIVQHRLALLIISFLIFIHAALTYGTAVTFHHEFKSSGVDTGVFFQQMWNLMTIGKPLTGLTVPNVEQNWLGFHFSPLMYVFAPLVKFTGGFYVLNLISSISIALTALPIYMAAFYLLKRQTYALIWAVIFLINPFVINAAVIDFHEICLSAPILAFATYFLLTQNKRSLIICLTLLLFIKEHYGLAWLGSAIAWWLLYGDKKLALRMSVFGIVWTGFILLIVRPYFAPEASAFLTSSGAAMSSNIGWVLRIPSEPELLGIMALEGLAYLFVLGLPLLFFPAWGWLIALPALADLVANTATLSGYTRQVFAYNSLPIIGVLVIASIYGGVKWAEKSERRHVKDVIIVVGIMSLMAGVTQWSLPFSFTANYYGFSGFYKPMAKEDKQAIETIRDLIQENDVISAATNTSHWFAKHRAIFEFPYRVSDANVIIWHLGKVVPEPSTSKVPPLFGLDYEKYYAKADEVLNDASWQPIYLSGNWVMLRREASKNNGLKVELVDKITKQREHYLVNLK